MLLSKALMRGLPIKIGDAIAVSGVARMSAFGVPTVPGQAPVVTCEAIGTFSALTGNLEVSSNGGTDYSTFMAFDFAAAAVFIFDATPGLLYRFNPSTVTETTTVDIMATLA